MISAASSLTKTAIAARLKELFTLIEFSLLWYLCEHQGRVVSSEELFEAVWKEKYLNSNNTVMAHIGRLRGKMKEPAKN